MTEFENIVIGKSSIPSLILTVVLMIAVPVVFFLYWRRKHKEKTKIRWLIAGAAGSIISVSSRIIRFPGLLTETRPPMCFTERPWQAFSKSAAGILF